MAHSLVKYVIGIALKYIKRLKSKEKYKFKSFFTIFKPNIDF